MIGFYKPGEVEPVYDYVYKNSFVDLLRIRSAKFYFLKTEEDNSLSITLIPVTLENLGNFTRIATQQHRPKDRFMKSWPSFDEIFSDYALGRVNTSYGNWENGKWSVIVGITTL